MTIPGNVLRFERLMYLSLLLNIMSEILFKRGMFTYWTPDSMRALAVLLIVVAVGCSIIHLATRKRKNWARWFLLISQVSSVESLFFSKSFGEIALNIGAVGLGFVGLYFAFTGDAAQWYTPAVTR
jgi:hypothetical protein